MQSAHIDGTAASGTASAANPVSPWVNAALGALDAGVSTSQQLLDGVDRLARAGASVEPGADAAPPALSPAVWGGTRAAIACNIAVAAAVQRSAISLFTQTWRQWAEALHDLARIDGSEASVHPAATEDPNTLDRAARASRLRRASAHRGSRKPSRATSEHASASGGTKQRSTRRGSSA